MDPKTAAHKQGVAVSGKHLQASSRESKQLQQ